MYSAPAVGSEQRPAKGWAESRPHQIGECRSGIEPVVTMYSAPAAGMKQTVFVSPRASGERGAPRSPEARGETIRHQFPRQESNLVPDLRTVVCFRHTPRMGSIPARI